jgi:hypothetical protein
MVDEPTNQQPMSDDQELAKVLAGVSQQADDPIISTTDEPIVTTPVPEPFTPPEPAVVPESPAAAEAPAFDTPSSSSANSTGELDGIKLEALQELRPLVDKLDVSADEKFDTYLLLLRSTDDKELIAPAHEAAKNIPDETRRAQALLDIIKEIDFLSQNQK